jgi:hypothetical protein
MRKGRRNAMMNRLNANKPKVKIKRMETGTILRLGDKKEYIVLPNGAWKRMK